MNALIRGVVGQGGAAPVQDSVDVRVAAINDNLTIVPSVSHFGNGDPLYWIDGPDPPNECSFRYPNLAIPQGATILAATLTGYGRASYTAGASRWATLGAEQTDDAQQPTDISTFQAKSSNLGTTVQWDASTVGANGAHVSPDLTTVIQEVINRAGWSSGNALQLFAISNTAADVDYQLWSYWNGTAAYYPRLEIDFEYIP